MGLVKLNDRGVRSATTFGSVSGGSFTFIKKLTASSSATLSFVDGASDVVLDDTYKEYMFTFKDMHPQTDEDYLSFNFSVDSGSNYNVTKTSAFFRAYNYENNSDRAVAYETGYDQAQSTAFHALVEGGISSDNDASLSGSLTLFNPSSTTFVKHFIANAHALRGSGSPTPLAINNFIGGYGNTTSAVDAVQFKMESGDIDAGTIKLYGIA